MYQDYLDVDIDQEPEAKNQPNKGMQLRGGEASQIVNTDEVEEESEGNDEELIENNNEFQRKKPNSVTGILSGGAGLMVRKQ